MLKLNIKLLIDPPPQKKMTMAHFSPSVDRDRRPLTQGRPIRRGVAIIRPLEVLIIVNDTERASSCLDGTNDH